MIFKGPENFVRISKKFELHEFELQEFKLDRFDCIHHPHYYYSICMQVAANLDFETPASDRASC